MAELVICEKQDLINIANTIREKNSEIGSMYVSNMASYIADMGTSSFKVTFPEYHLNETLYYTNKNGVFNSYTRMTAEPITIEVLQDTIIYSNNNVFDNQAYTYTNEDKVYPLSMPASGACYAIAIRGDVEFGWADGAPI